MSVDHSTSGSHQGHQHPREARLFHSLLAQHKRQAICLPFGLYKRLSVASENCWEFLPVTSAHSALLCTQDAVDL